MDCISDPISLMAFLMQREETTPDSRWRPSLILHEFTVKRDTQQPAEQSGTFVAGLDFIAPCLCADEEGIFSSRRRLPGGAVSMVAG